MLSVLRHILYLALVFILQTTWVRHLQIGGLQPDLILLVIVFIALLAGQIEAALLGFAIGLCQDTYSPQDLGLNALAKSLVGFAVGVGRGGILADSVQVQVAVLIAAVLLHDSIFYIGSSATSISEVPYLMVRFGIGRAIYTGILGFFIAWLLRIRRELIPA
ncbi:MAG: rod shape-determining protein MreD [Candidatus Latescibacteria bacterium]|jgi:rod shape-determining protein MreD|nr:rod shape-determining protein MreD [Gemmatimonadaceae bacterium]MDP6017296.1 rod shape-determining protein MreD [Candidatus Latescibacterota bacterium]MDP7448003.1 rod shape-determining protein MreD [Candidatus Latescibacterota bacterium]HJP32210.1 rod shape-determining protein MreD [Candidatus Latescibacterota bacterium]